MAGGIIGVDATPASTSLEFAIVVRPSRIDAPAFVDEGAMSR